MTTASFTINLSWKKSNGNELKKYTYPRRMLSRTLCTRRVLVSRPESKSRVDKKVCASRYRTAGLTFPCTNGQPLVGTVIVCFICGHTNLFATLQSAKIYQRNRPQLSRQLRLSCSRLWLLSFVQPS